MILKRLRLKNIRSYTEGDIKFPEGIVLLEGDIGSGKSSVLYAIDFALFGLRSELPGNSLLRNGENKGEVILSLNINNKTVEIKRTLERKNSSVVQKDGYISVNGVVKKGSPLMLREEINEILGYKQKGKREQYSPFYYTVYTAQEQMKNILLGSKDDRLKTMRNIFEIDKYKRIRDNSKIYVKKLKEDIKFIEGFVSDLEELKKELKTKKDSIKEYQKDFSSLKNKFIEIENELIEIRNTLKELRRSELEKKDVERKLSLSKEIKSRNLKDIEELKKEIDRKRKIILETDKDSLLSKKAAIEKKISEEDGIRKRIDELNEHIEINNKKIVEAETRINESRRITSEISRLDECPLCMQNVSHSHKESIRNKENKKIERFEKIKDIFSKENETLKKELELLNKEREKILDLKKELVEVKIKIKNVEGVKEEVDSLENKIQKLLDENYTKDKEIMVLQRKLEEFMDKTKEIEKYEELERNLLKRANEAGNNVAVVKEKINSLEGEIKDLEARINEKEKKNKDMNYKISIRSWLEGVFIPLMETIEKHVFGRIYNEFDLLFRTWFSKLVEDDEITAHIDEYFTPVITQNGYNIPYGFLSGGEKTSIALAYRLALNKVVNGIADNLNTKDLLILDEPTDGFSTEQLDRVRDVLLSLDLKQIIIVSHEQKLSDFVDARIKFKKSNHITYVEGEDYF